MVENYAVAQALFHRYCHLGPVLIASPNHTQTTYMEVVSGSDALCLMHVNHLTTQARVGPIALNVVVRPQRCIDRAWLIFL